ncbi:major capsid protein [Capybara microvirus Cap1_SP_140]|nr:major capsid protein [Capybara microvirus Cap1_SP_140]
MGWLKLAGPFFFCDMKSVMNFDFSKVPTCSLPRSVFDRTSGHKTTFDVDYLVPFFLDEVLPGDTFSCNSTFLIRFNDLLRPFMDNLYFDTFWFFVPNRLVWEHWVNLMGEKKGPADTTDYVVPTIDIPATAITEQSLHAYFGLPINLNGAGGSIQVNALPYRAYYLIWNEFFRDENLQSPVSNITGDSGGTDYHLMKRGKRHDYFTSALPWPQKGPAVTLPLGTTAPVIGNGKTLGFTNGSDFFGLGSGFTVDNNSYFLGNSKGSYGSNVGSGAGASELSQKTAGITTDPEKSGLICDLSTATAATINQLREAFAIQRLYERDARGGTRYFEMLQSGYGVHNPDARLQRPEYLGGSSQRINVTTIAQTSSATSNSPQGNLAAFSSTGAHSGFRKSFTEFGYVIGLCCVRADLTYHQGVERHWFRKTRFDFYHPVLAHLGEQAVYNKEIYWQGNTKYGDDKAFGYQERWAEYRYKPSRISGYLSPNSSLPLDQWHLSQHFDECPKLNGDFIQENVPINRVRAVTDIPATFLMDSYTSLKCARVMPTYSVPGMIDHF